ncbi:DUF3025 domain-containing protein [Vogesella oryzae]|uniref:DUF3025 domain-containing protein n=1 Tax=Vogesella oryzae TaxID=1735285 RepID=UPI001C2EBDF7|nr:DUF3025 domain-containing protein [Vogesella oryzae]
MAAQGCLPTTFAVWPQHPLYRSLAPWRAAAQFADWPRQAEYDALLAQARASGQPLPPALRFACDLEPTQYYEMHIGSSGEIPTRTQNWHDWFGALAWLSWPQSKLALNARHVRAIERGEVGRGPFRDAATLLDECGVIVPVCDDALANALQEMDWQALFVQHAAAWGTRIDSHVLGHALFEQGLAMHIGWCGKALLLPVAADFFALDYWQRQQALDARLAALLADDDWLQRPRELLPLPLLGIPGWWQPQDAAFYANTAYFRPTRRANSATLN